MLTGKLSRAHYLFFGAYVTPWQKAGFLKSSNNRCAAVRGLTALLRFHLSHHENSTCSSLSQSQSEMLSSVRVSGVSVDEMLAMSRRFLQQQPTVRAEYYAELYLLQQEFPAFRASAMSLLAGQLRTIFTGSDFRTVSREKADGEPLDHLLLTLFAVSLKCMPAEDVPVPYRRNIQSRPSVTLSQSKKVSGLEADAQEMLRSLWSLVSLSFFLLRH